MRKDTSLVISTLHLSIIKLQLYQDHRMKLLQLVTLLTLVATIFGQRSYAEFEIRKRSTSGDKSVAVGKLSLNFVPAYNSIEPSVRSYMDELISEDDFGGSHQAILQFVCIETDLPEYKDRVYMTSVDELSSEPHGQKIAIILGPHADSPSINSINYVQTRDRVSEIYTQVVQTKVKEDLSFKYEYAPKKADIENDSFWARYKWPIIIGGVVMYTMTSMGGGEKGK